MRTIYRTISKIASWLYNTLELYEEPGASSVLGEILDLLARIAWKFYNKADVT